MKLSLCFASVFLSLSRWVDSVRAESSCELQVFSPMPPVRTASGVYSGKDLILGTEEDDPPDSLHICLMEESFENSYGKPWVAELPRITIPFDAIWLNVTIRSKGHQFDRLATMWIDDTEIMRLSTAEPTDYGVVSYISKDLTQYVPIFKDVPNKTTSKKFIFDMGNLVNDMYNAPIHVTVDAYFYQSRRQAHDHADGPRTSGALPTPAQRIIPVSALRGSSEGKQSAWNFPSEKPEMKFRLPKSTTRAVLTVAATGQGAEEFWWSNLPESATGYFGSSTRLPGLSSFREVRVYIDDMEAGYAWPFPVVFTGGISPSLHRPVAGIQAFDLRETEIDLTPWLELLRDGEEHVIRMGVWGVDDSGSRGPVFKQVGSDWLLSGKIFLWESVETPSNDHYKGYKNGKQIANADKETLETHKDKGVAKAGKGTWGADTRDDPNHRGPDVSHAPMDYRSTIKPLGDGSFRYTQSISRNIVFETPDLKKRGRNKAGVCRTTQEYQMENTGAFRDWSQTQEVKSKYTGGSQSSFQGEKGLATRFTYEIETTASYKTTPEVPLSLEANLSQGLEMAVTNHSPLAEGAYDILEQCGSSAGTILSNHKSGSSNFTQRADGTAEGRGATAQHYSLSAMNPVKGYHIGSKGNTWYRRDLQYESNDPIKNKQYFMGKEASVSGSGTTSDDGFQPSERHHDLEPSPNGTMKDFSDGPLDYAPFPLVRFGIPNIYLRDRMAIESSTVVNIQT